MGNRSQWYILSHSSGELYTVLVFIIAWIWISYEGGLSTRLSILVFLPIEAVEH